MVDHPEIHQRHKHSPCIITTSRYSRPLARKFRLHLILLLPTPEPAALDLIERTPFPHHRRVRPVSWG